jgi:WD repeat-containing protein 48
MDGSSMLGTDVEEALLPEWVVDVAAERYKVPDAPKASFYIAEHPEEEGRESALASGKGTAITSGKVTAPRVLSVRKVCSYVVAKLGLDLNDDVAVEDAVEIFCDGKKLDPSWSLATVREHVWRRGDDLRVTFRVTEAVAKPAGE